MDNELSNILENTPPKQNGINISQISKDTLKNIINDNSSEDMSLYEVDDVSVKRSNTLNKFLLKSREKEDNEERLKDKEDKKKLREEAKEEEKKKREEDKKKKDEEKKKKEEEKKNKRRREKKRKGRKKERKGGKEIKRERN
jgi:outer membrane biosynthesis protein TonB